MKLFASSTAGTGATRRGAILRAFLLLSFGIAGVELLRLKLATDAVEREESALESLASDARQVATLKDLAPDQELDAKKETDLIEKVSAALDQSGLSRTALQSLSPDGLRAAGRKESSDVSIQSARFVLADLDEPALGRFLSVWREREPLWRVEALEAVFLSVRDESPSSDEDGPASLKKMRVTVKIEARYHRSARP